MRIEEKAIGKAGGRLRAYINEDLTEVCGSHTLHPALLILPGGGYNHCSPREAEPVALRYLSHSINCFVLDYPVGKDIKVEKPIETVALAVDEIFANSAHYGVDTTRVAIIGFSAGAHLAASYCTLRQDDRLSAMILGYPVITSGDYAHRGSFDMLCESDEEKELYSLERRVTASTPPAFIFSSADDATVPIENSLLFAQALSSAKVPFELHIFPSAKHGSSIGTAEVGTRNEVFAGWLPLSLRWLFDTWRYEE